LDLTYISVACAVVHRRGVAAGVGFPRLAAPDVQERVGSVRLAGFSGHGCHDGGHDMVAHTGLFYRFSVRMGIVFQMYIEPHVYLFETPPHP